MEFMLNFGTFMELRRDIEKSHVVTDFVLKGFKEISI